MGLSAGGQFLAPHYHLTSAVTVLCSTALGFGARSVHLKKAGIMNRHLNRAGGKVFCFLPYQGLVQFGQHLKLGQHRWEILSVHLCLYVC